MGSLDEIVSTAGTKGIWVSLSERVGPEKASLTLYRSIAFAILLAICFRGVGGIDFCFGIVYQRAWREATLYYYIVGLFALPLSIPLILTNPSERNFSRWKLFRWFLIVYPHTLGRFGKRELVGGTGFGLLAGFLFLFFGSAIFRWEVNQSPLLSRLLESLHGKAILLVLLALIPPFEELFYRSFLFSLARIRWSSLVASFLVIIWFALDLAPQYPGPRTWLGLPLFLLLMARHAFLTWEFYAFSSPAMNLVSHWVCNLVFAIAMLSS